MTKYMSPLYIGILKKLPMILETYLKIKKIIFYFVAKMSQCSNLHVIIYI